MPRRLIIGILIVLIIGVIGGTIYFVVRQFSGSDTTQQASTGTGQLELAESGPQAVDNPTGDDDNDGLTNAEEALWSTDRNRADSDNDGTRDGLEVSTNRNPTIAGPNDQLPPGFNPSVDLQPLAEAPLRIDELFESVNLNGPRQNLTNAYNQRFDEDEQSATTLTQFIEEQPLVTKLPTVQSNAIKFSTSNSSSAMRAYLKTAANFQNMTDPLLVKAAIDDILEKKDIQAAAGLAVVANLYQEQLANTSVPPNAETTHRLLLGYSEALAATYQLMTIYNEDPVKGLYAIRQLEEFSNLFSPLIDSELERLSAAAAG